jgi:hypothetical protein
MWILILAATIACGKKGPPLPPFVRVPAAVGQLAAHRIGDDVVVTFALPVQNVDESTPVSLARVDVYAYTARTAPPLSRFTQVAHVVGQIDTKSPPPGVQTVRDTLTPEKLAEGPPLPTLSTAAPALTSPSRDPSRVPLKRFYIAIPFSERGRPGPPSSVIEVPLTALPDAPVGLRTTYTADAVTLRWDPSGGIVGFLLDVAALPGASPLDDGPPVAEPGTLPPGPTRYMVYREAGDESEPKKTEDNKEDNKPASPVRKTPINPMPIDGLSFTDPLPQGDNNRRCYVVSALRGGRERGVEGHPSMIECMTPVDVFPPARPTGVSPIAVEGAVSLVWEANSEPDLQGYLVFRGEEGGEMLMRITDEPVKATRYTDQDVKPGVRYVYAVVAVDTQNPPNASPESERVEVTAR